MVHVHDGDTLSVRLGGKTRRVRITGINAPELSRYSSDPRRRRGDRLALVTYSAITVACASWGSGRC